MKKFLKTLWNVIWPFLVYYAATLVVTFGMYIIYTGRQLLSGKGFDVETVYDTVMNGSLWQVLIVSVIVIPIYWIAIRKERTVDAEITVDGEPTVVKSFERYKTYPFKTYIIMALCGAFAAIAANYFNYFAMLFIEDPLYDMVADALAAAPLWVEVIVAVIVGPLAEEVMFRGKLYETIDRAYGYVTAIIVTSLLFGIFHGNITQFIYATMLGFLLGYVRYKSGSLLLPVVMHVGANLCSVLMDVLMGIIPTPNIMYADLIIESLLAIVSLGVVVICVVYINQVTRCE